MRCLCARVCTCVIFTRVQPRVCSADSVVGYPSYSCSVLQLSGLLRQRQEPRPFLSGEAPGAPGPSHGEVQC